MKKIFIGLLLVVVIMALTSPSFGHGWYYGGCGWGGCGYNGWEAAVIVGGSILLGTFLGMAINNSYRYPPPPQPVYVYPELEQPYASPDPSFIEQYSQQKETENYPGSTYNSREDGGSPPGTWVTVPGQWVQGTWVPDHWVWVPENP